MRAAEWRTATEIAVIAAAASLVVTGAAVKVARWRGLFDVPNERSSHSVPTPRIGGVGLFCGLLVGVLLTPLGAEAFIPLLGSFWLGLYDDRHSLRPSVKFVALLAIVSVPVIYGFARVDRASSIPYVGIVEFRWLGVPLALTWLACYPNAFNFMDGLNGIASLVAAVSGAFFVAAGVGGDDPCLMGWGAAAVGAALGFLPWNAPTARTFMGDCGSLPTGLILAMCAFRAEQSHALSFPASVLLLGPFLFDVTFTLARRWRERKGVGAPHREHLYQRLSRVWGSHAKVSLLYAGFSVVTGCLALCYGGLTELGKLLSLTLPVAAMLGFAAFVLRAERVKGS